MSLQYSDWFRHTLSQWDCSKKWTNTTTKMLNTKYYTKKESGFSEIFFGGDGGGEGVDCCIFTGRALKFILYDFSSNFILNIRPVKISPIICPHSLFVVDRQRLSLIMEFHCYTALVLELGFKFCYLIAT